MSKKYVSTAPSGVVVEAEFPPPPYEHEDDWMRFGHFSFWFFSYKMWAVKCRQGNPMFFAFLTRFVPLTVLAMILVVALS